MKIPEIKKVAVLGGGTIGSSWATNFLWKGFSSDSEVRMVMGLGPDRQWLGFVRNLSTGAFSRADANHEFNAHGDFIPKYASRRELLEKQIKTTDSLRTAK